MVIKKFFAEGLNGGQYPSQSIFSILDHFDDEIKLICYSTRQSVVENDTFIKIAYNGLSPL
jgi:hypothetical protein